MFGGRRRRIGWCISTTGLVGLVSLAGCLSTTQTEVRPEILLPLDEGTPAVASVPGTVVDVGVAWTARCTTDGVVPDTSTTEACDEQAFVATVTCSGGPCELDPPAAASGVAMTGEGKVHVTLPAAGDVAIDVVIEHAGTHARLAKKGRIAIRAMDRLVIDCRMQAYDAASPRCVERENFTECFDRPWVACPTTGTATADPVWGTPVSVWVWGEGGGLPIAPRDGEAGTVEMTGLVLPSTDYVDNGHANVAAAWAVKKFTDTVKTAGTMRVVARQNGMVAERVLQLATP